MGNLRDIVRRNEEEQTLREYLKNDFDTTPQVEKDRMLDYLKSQGNIDDKVDKILDAFRKEIGKGSGRKVRRLAFNIGFVIANLIVTPLVSYTVNHEHWPVLIGISSLYLLFVIVVSYIMFSEDL